MRSWRWYWVLGCCGLWALPLRAEVKVIPVFEAEGMVRTLKEIYPALGVSAMGNQLVLSGTPAQLQEAQATLDQLNQPPQSLLIEWRVAGASNSRQAGIGIGNDNAKRRWLVEGGCHRRHRLSHSPSTPRLRRAVPLPILGRIETRSTASSR